MGPPSDPGGGGEERTESGAQHFRKSLAKSSKRRRTHRVQNMESNPPNDRLGERILELLLQWERKRQQAAPPLHWQWKPFLSFHNAKVLYQSLRSLHTANAWNREMFVTFLNPYSLVFFLWDHVLLPFTALLLSVLFIMSFLFIIGALAFLRIIAITVSFVLELLIDYPALFQNKFVQRIGSLLHYLYYLLDYYICQGYRYAGREWNSTRYLFPTPQEKGSDIYLIGKCPSHDFSTLSLCPPPDMSTDMHRWSYISRKHVQAINYCHAVLIHQGVDELTQSDKTVQSVNRHTDVALDRKENNFDDSKDLVPAPNQVEHIPTMDRVHCHKVNEGADMAWIDVGATIGLRLLNSEHIQRAMTSQDAKDRILEQMTGSTSNAIDNDGSAVKFTPSTGGSDYPSAVAKRNLKSPKRSTAESSSGIVVPKPIHSMWTSPRAAVETSAILQATCSYMEPAETDDSALRNIQSYPPAPSVLPPLSPTTSPISCRPLSQLIHPADVPKFPLNPLLHSPNSLSRSDQFFLTPIALASSHSAIQLPDLSCSVSIAPRPMSDRSKHFPLNRRLSSGVLENPVRTYRRLSLQAGTKIAVPIMPLQPTSYSREIMASSNVSYMMATVVSSDRILTKSIPINGETQIDHMIKTNCLSVTVKLDKFFLRNGEFADLTIRIMDDWSPRYMPRHSKVPVGACVATSFGIGVLVGWRVEDDCHIVRSLWQCRGPGSAYAYLNRDAIHGTTVAANGFHVQSVFGQGIVRACVNGGLTFTSSRFYVEIREHDHLHKGNVLDLDSKDIISCHGAQFLPVVEHVRAAALYQIQLDNYNAVLRSHRLIENSRSEEQEFLRIWSDCAEILWKSFLKAVEEDKDFDDGVHEFVQSVIEFLDRLDQNDVDRKDSSIMDEVSLKPEIRLLSTDEIEIQLNSTPDCDNSKEFFQAAQEPGFWFMNDLFGGIFKQNDGKNDITAQPTVVVQHPSEDEDLAAKRKKSYFDRAFAVLRSVMKTVSIARASSVDYPHFRLALAILYDVLLFVRTILRIQQRNTSIDSLRVWKRAWGEILATFGPIKERLESIGRGIAYRMEHQGKKAKIRVLNLVDNILGDERLLVALEQGEWDNCLARVEIALVQAEVIEEKNLIYYRKAAKFVYEQLEMVLRSNEEAAARNNEKLALLGCLIQSMAAPRRSVLKIFTRDDTLELLERILVRTYCKEEIATRMLIIHAANFYSLRHLRMLKDFSVSGRIWIPLLDAANEELTCFVSNLPENSKGIVHPLSILFSLCVAQFHKINDGDLSKDWLAFLLEEESVQIIQEIDMRLILALESFSRDIREMMTVLPYYASIDADILNLMDEVNVDEFLREAASVIDDPDKLALYLREKATIAIERFLNYLPKMSIPIEKRDLGDGWMLSCHGIDGGGLTMTDVTIRRENVVCQIMGGDTLFFPMFADNECVLADSISTTYSTPPVSLSASGTYTRVENEEESILNHIKVLILNAQKYGCWQAGFGGVGESPSDPYAALVFQDVPVSNVLNCSIDLWRNLQIDDDELLEIAIRDISYHIHLQEREERKKSQASHCADYLPHVATARCVSESTSSGSSQSQNHQQFIPRQQSSTSSVDGATALSHSQRRFNPRIDPTILFLEIKRLTLNLDNFHFRIEKSPDRKTIFDPVFAGRGMLSLKNISIRLRIECAKERVIRPEFSMEIVTPILQLRSLEVSLEKLTTTVKDTGFGSDWILNKAVEVFEDKLTEVVESNLKDQIEEQVQSAIGSLNSYFLVNPNVLLSLLDVSMDDLEENVVLV